MAFTRFVSGMIRTSIIWRFHTHHSWSTDISIREDFVSDDEIQTALREESVKQLQGSRNSDFGLSAAAMSASSSSQGAGSVSNVRVTAADSGLVRISGSSMDTWSVRSGLPSEL
jgi:hypothetical protein